MYEKENMEEETKAFSKKGDGKENLNALVKKKAWGEKNQCNQSTRKSMGRKIPSSV